MILSPSNPHAPSPTKKTQHIPQGIGWRLSRRPPPDQQKELKKKKKLCNTIKTRQ